MIKINAMTQARLLRLLWDGTHTLKELAAESGLHYLTVCHYVRELRKQGMARIDHYEVDSQGRYCMPVYRLGPGKDCKRPQVSPSEKQRRYRAKKRAREQLMVMAGRGPLREDLDGRPVCGLPQNGSHMFGNLPEVSQISMARAAACSASSAVANSGAELTTLFR